MRLRLSHPMIGELTVPVDDAGIVVGRAGGHADLDMNWDPVVSRRHVRFWVSNDTLWFEDLQSRNGTWELGARRIGPHPLRQGVWLLVGETYIMAAPPETRARPDPSGLGPHALASSDIIRGSATLDVHPPSSLVEDLVLSSAPQSSTPPPGPKPQPTRAAVEHRPGASPAKPAVHEKRSTSAHDKRSPSAAIPHDEPRIAATQPQPREESALRLVAPPVPAAVRDAPAMVEHSFSEHTLAELATLTAPPDYAPDRVHDAELVPQGDASAFGNTTGEFPAPLLSAVADTLPPASPEVPATQDHAGRARGNAARPSQEPRFSGENTVALELSDRQALKNFWLQSVERGGLYVHTERPPERLAHVEVHITTPGNTLRLTGQVVLVLDVEQARKLGQPAGVGIQFIQVSAGQRDAVFRYLDGITSNILPSMKDSNEVRVRLASLDQVLARAKHFMSLLDENKIYAALQIDPRASQPEIMQRIGDLQNAIMSVEPVAPPPHSARLEATRRQLERLATLMGSIERRLEYDFRHGHVRAEERINDARHKRGPNMRQLRGIWHAALPKNLTAAANLVHAALAAKKRSNYKEAAAIGKRALELDPFQEELRTTVAAWVEAGKSG